MEIPTSRAFRRREGGLWHMCLGCPEYPLEGQFSEILAGINFPIRDHLSCPECLQLIESGACEWMAKEPPPPKKKRPFPYPGHWWKGGG